MSKWASVKQVYREFIFLSNAYLRVLRGKATMSYGIDFFVLWAFFQLQLRRAQKKINVLSSFLIEYLNFIRNGTVK
jgi:hypothetical protein